MSSLYYKQFNCSVLSTFPGNFPATSINLLAIVVIVNLTKVIMHKHLWCKSRIIPGSECMKRLATRSDIRMRSRLSILNLNA